MGNSVTAEIDKKKDFSFYLHIAVTLALMLGISCIPPIEPITPFGMQMIGIFAGMLYGWTFSGIIWTSLVGMIAMGLTEYATFTHIVETGMGNTITQLVLMSCLFIAAIEKCQLSRYIALWMLSRKMLRGRPWLFSGFILLVALLLGAFVTPIAGVLLCCLITYDVCAQVGFKQGDGYPTVMIIGIFILGIIGMGGIPWGIVPLIVMGSFTQMSGEAFNFLTYFLYYWPIAIIILAAYILLCKYVFRIDVKLMCDLDVDKLFSSKGYNKTMTHHQKLVFTVLLIYIATMISPNLLPETWFLAKILDKVGVLGIMIFYVVLLQLIKVDGKALISFQEDAKHIQWEAVILTAAVMPLSNMLTVKETGITAFLVTNLGGMISGGSVIVFAAIIFFLATLITNFCNNAVTGVLLLPIICNFAPILGISASVIAIPMIMCLHLAIMTPAACPISAMLHSNREWVKTLDIYKYGGAGVLVSMVIVMTIGFAWMSTLA